MVRGKTEMKRIENETCRQVTFSKRRNGLHKKAFELSVLCDAEVGLIIFSPRGKLFEFSSTSRGFSLTKTIDRYQQKVKDERLKDKRIQEIPQEEAISLTKKIEHLEVSERKLLGDGLDACALEELLQLQNQLERSLNKIRDRKNHLFKEKIEKLREEKKCLLEENKKLREKVVSQGGMQPMQPSTKEQQCVAEKKWMEVETELFIGIPK